MKDLSRSSVTRGALLWVGLGVSALFGYLVVRDVRWADVWAALRTSDYWWLVPAFAMLAVANVVRALRWQALYERNTRPGFRPTLGAMLVGQMFNNLLPARAGEAARIVFLHRRAGVSRVETAATVVLERAFDVLALLVLLFVLVPWLPRVTWLRTAGVLAVVLAALLLAGVFVLARYGDRPLRLLLRPLARLRFVGAERFDHATGNFVQGFAGLRRLRSGAAAAALTLLSWVLLGLSNWLLMPAFDLGLSPLAGILVAVATGLGMVIPSSPAGVGVFEAAALVALNAYGIRDAEALSYALVLHAMNLVPYLAAGVIVLRVR